MIKTELFDSILSGRQKYVKRSYSLKKTMITFPFDGQGLSQSVVKNQAKKKTNQPCIKSSQIMKKKVQRQRYVKQFDEKIANPQKSYGNQFGKTSQNLIKRSHSMKISSSRITSNYSKTPIEKFRKRAVSNTQRAQEIDNLFGQFQEDKDSSRNPIKLSRTKQNFQTQRKDKYDLGQYSSNKNTQQVFTCRSLRKSTQIQFCNEQIAALINKKKLKSSTKQEDSSDETSFKVVLQKIKSKDLAQISKSSMNQQKLRYLEKVKNDKIYTIPMQVNYNYLIQNPSSAKNFRSVQQQERRNFQSALQWSNKQTLLMKKKLFIKSSNKQLKNSAKGNHILFNKKSDQIVGWQK